MVTWNFKDYRRFLHRRSKAGELVYSHMGLIGFQCPETSGESRLRAYIELIEHEAKYVQGLADKRSRVLSASISSECFARDPPRRAMSATREVARYVVELRWHAPRTWGARKLPHGGRFYAWALFESPRRRLWTYAEATGVIGPGGVETTELAILTSDDDPNVPDLQPADPFELSRSGVEGVGIAAHGRVVVRKADARGRD